MERIKWELVLLVVNAIVISASSDIGGELCRSWHGRGWNLYGTYRTISSQAETLSDDLGVKLFHCDLADVASIDDACKELIESCEKWDVLVLAPGSVEPIGDFKDLDFDKWEEGIQINLLRQLRVLHHLLPYRNLNTSLSEPSVLFFAGGGANNAVLHYSSYTLSKIALTKMCELLDAEIPDTRFVILGPGLVKTKIHEPTLTHSARAAGENCQRTLNRLKNNECTPMKDVVDSCTWLVTTPCRAVRARNFSTAFDKWGTVELENALEEDKEMYKLRRSGNLWKR